MDHPQNIDLPFFAYGLFRPGQLAFFQLRELVSKVEQSTVPGSLLLRDGLPIIDPAGKGAVNGTLLTFQPTKAAEAYNRIAKMEPDAHYRWHQTSANGTSSNVLVGRSPKRGSVPWEDADWNGWNDPLFTAALDVVGEETLKSVEFESDLKPLFKLQMAYLLLWSSIERYVSLRYHLGDKVSEKVAHLASEKAFAESLQKHVTDKREVQRSDRPGDKVVLDPTIPDKAIRYYYQVRSNITHRGKGAVRDHDLLKKSSSELLSIFRDVLKAAEIEERNNAVECCPAAY